MSQLPNSVVDAQESLEWPDGLETLECASRIIDALRRLPLLPTPRLASAVASSLARVYEQPCSVVFAIGSWECQNSWSPIIVGRNAFGNEQSRTRSYASKVVQQPLPPTGITRTFRAPRSELAASLSGPVPQTGSIPMDVLSSIHLTDFGTVVEATWRGLSGDASPMARTMLSCVMARAAQVVDGAFPQGVLKSKMLTPTELRVAGWLLSGESRRSMAAISGRSTHTISDHIKRLYRKLEVNSKGELFKRLVPVDLTALG